MKTKNITTVRTTPKSSEILNKFEARHPESQRSRIVEQALVEYQHRQAELTDRELEAIAETHQFIRTFIVHHEGNGKEKPNAQENARNGRTVNEVLGRIMARCIELRKKREPKP